MQRKVSGVEESRSAAPRCGRAKSKAATWKTLTLSSAVAQLASCANFQPCRRKCQDEDMESASRQWSTATCSKLVSTVPGAVVWENRFSSATGVRHLGPAPSRNQTKCFRLLSQLGLGSNTRELLLKAVWLRMQRRSRKGVLLLSALFCGWKIAPSFLDPQPVKNVVADVGRPGRRDVLGGMALLTMPDVAWAKRASSSGGDQNLPTQQSMPGEIETEESISEDWQPVDVGESTLVDPDDPKYKQMSKLAKEIEKQKAKNDEFDKMTQEEKQQKMCELLGRGCSSI
ncbi:unnamed protein product [Symbiodinium sp. CCMP2592]|nr:unnamed protein product [Symbiodinium sp. CCMP2592]